MKNPPEYPQTDPDDGTPRVPNDRKGQRLFWVPVIAVVVYLGAFCLVAIR